jgi:hypothetical protein
MQGPEKFENRANLDPFDRTTKAAINGAAIMLGR